MIHKTVDTPGEFRCPKTLPGRNNCRDEIIKPGHGNKTGHDGNPSLSVEVVEDDGPESPSSKRQLANRLINLGHRGDAGDLLFDLRITFVLHRSHT